MPKEQFGCKNGPYGYIYFQDCDVVGGLVILRKTTNSMFVIRKEFPPVVSDYIYTVVTGCMEEDESDPLETFLRELKEEAGLFFNSYEVKFHDHYENSHKAVAGALDLFVVCSDDFELTEPSTDGTYYEQLARILVLPKEAVFTLLRSGKADLYLTYLLRIVLGTGLL